MANNLIVTEVILSRSRPGIDSDTVPMARAHRKRFCTSLFHTIGGHRIARVLVLGPAAHRSPERVAAPGAGYRRITDAPIRKMRFIRPSSARRLRVVSAE